MKNLEHWFICLDLSKMDDILIGYINFLTSVVKPKTISFFHVVESGSVADEMVELFPDIESEDDFEDVIRKEISDKISSNFESLDDIETRVIIKEGRPTDEIIELMNSMDPDLLVMGKKTGYKGEGVIARRIVKYVPSSILFVPENSRYAINTILTPVDYSEQSANAIKTSLELVSSQDGKVRAQHIFKYPSHFFPYMPSDEEKAKLRNHLEEKESEFKEEYDIPAEVDFSLTLHKEGRMGDDVYDEAVRNQADLIVVGAKSGKKITSILRDDFTDKMTYYSFGIPLLVVKNKDKHRKFLSSLFRG
ncbi:universal stress protein [Gracilimonas mengyeensis]|uniref:Nucleotide-binding universal stress protein, UspA family n=1 Tax=Gracilimonas mengyeensis TaxID=1302730 RepID=A0A521BS30_9BACT|nr:universal stress protein [Gracilimonas mengyeensis]SMO49865.1 Nucleotide-binding universal stress protein, UspA family [Gracilimonas mengyeensis]